MQDLFRFMTLRPPEAIDDGQVSIQTALADSPFQNELRAEAGLPNALDAMLATAADYQAADQYIGDVAQVPLPFFQMEAEVIEKADDEDSLDVATVNGIIELVFEQGSAELIQAPVYVDQRRQVIDSLIAVTIAGDANDRHAQRLAHLLRLFALVEIAATQNPETQPEIVLSTIFGLKLLLPDTIFPLPARETAAAAPLDVQVQTDEQDELEQWLVDLRTARDELSDVDLDDFQPPSLPDDPDDPDTPDGEEDPDGSAGTIPDVQFWVLTPEAIDALSATTKAVAARLRIRLNRTPVPTIIGIIEEEIIRVGAELFKVEGNPQVIQVGSTIITLPAGSDQVGPGASLGTGTGGAFRPIGVADLMVVRQEIQRYEAGEVAHIENVLQGESKERTHRRAKRTEETFELETETTEESEKNLQTTERFELQRETKETIKTDQKLDLSLTVKYGGFVDVTASAQYTLNKSQEKSKQASSNYAREITERSVSKVQERVREQRTRTVVEEFEEKNLHGINNAGGTGHVVGVYRWVDKKYQAQVFNYGKRLMFEFIVPEPAAFTIAAASLLAREGEALVKPDPFRHRAKEITEFNFWGLAQKYGATDIEPPPERYRVVGKGLTKQTEDKKIDLNEVNEIEIPKGYKAISGYVLSPFIYFEDKKKAGLSIAIGNDYRNMQPSDFVNWAFNMQGETGSLSIGVQGFKISSYIVVISIRCQRTERELDEWRIRTHAAIHQAYLNQLAEYEERLAAAAINDGIEIEGRNPAQNREVEQAELRKSALMLLTEKTSPRFDNNGAIRETPTGAFRGYPELDFEEANTEGPYMQFFEQAFEWDQIMYTFYPYFWARKSRWPLLQQLQDTDPLYARFLQAGAARVLIPIRPGYEEAIFYYLDTGIAWKGSGPPPVTSPLYLPIVEEIKEQQGARFSSGQGTITVRNDQHTVLGKDTQFTQDDVDREIIIRGRRHRIATVESRTKIRLTEEYEGSSRDDIAYSLGAKFVDEPWDVIVPTSLVKLQEDASLPDFT